MTLYLIKIILHFIKIHIYIDFVIFVIPLSFHHNYNKKSLYNRQLRLLGETVICELFHGSLMLSFALISETVRDRAQRMIFWDHMYIILSMITAKYFGTFKNLHLSQKRLRDLRNLEITYIIYCQCSSQNIIQHFEKFQNYYLFSKIALILETVRDRAKRMKFGEYFQWSQFFFFWLHIFENFHSGCIFVQNFILAAYLCKILFRLLICPNFFFLLHICENLNVNIFVCIFSF